MAVHEPAIQVRGLRKAYGGNEAVRGVDLEVERGEVFALLGPNGAGKTTIVEILEGHRARTAGDVAVLGFDPGRAEPDFRRRIGIVLQSTGVERFLTVAEVIEQFRGYYPDPVPLDEIISVVGLDDKRDERVRRLSGGQQRRLDVAIGLAGRPELVFLDEPTTGFDPSARRGAWEMVKSLSARGTTVFLTTHYLDEAQYLADRVAVIADGVIVAEGPPSTLADRQRRATSVTFELADGAPALPDALAGWFVRDGARWQGALEAPTEVLHALTGWAVAEGVELRALEVRPPTLEDVYLSLTAPGPA